MTVDLSPPSAAAPGPQLAAEEAAHLSQVVAVLLQRLRLETPGGGIGGVPLIGIAGAQGTGKSTLASLLAQRLGERLGAAVAVLSLDDFYKSRHARNLLAARVHPLFRVRGQPGSHELEWLTTVLDRLQHPWAGPRSVRVPRFDKGLDERLPSHRWGRLVLPVAAVLLEGWCIGARPQPAAALQQPLNALERGADADGVFRRAVDRQLQGGYRALHERLDRLIFLAAPDMEAVIDWRWQQEQGLRGAQRLRSRQAVAGFVAHYERLTRWMLADVPARADVVLRLDRAHRFLFSND